jgi:hypothetical protein
MFNRSFEWKSLLTINLYNDAPVSENKTLIVMALVSESFWSAKYSTTRL